jgi:hypothetical protein
MAHMKPTIYGINVEDSQCPAVRSDGAPSDIVTCCLHDEGHEGLHRDHKDREWADSREMRIAVWSAIALWDLNPEPAEAEPDEPSDEFRDGVDIREAMERDYEEKRRLH